MTNSQEIATYSKERALTLVETLVECGYVSMLSKEEELYIINFIPTYPPKVFNQEDYEANRNCVVFMSKDEFEEKYYENERVENDNR